MPIHSVYTCQGLTLSQFRQEGRSLSSQLEKTSSVTISASYTKVREMDLTEIFSYYLFKIRRQGRKSYTELIQQDGLVGAEKTFETELETKEILAKIDAINNALTDDSSAKNTDFEEKSEGRTKTSSNIFQSFWDIVLG